MMNCDAEGGRRAHADVQAIDAACPGCGGRKMTVFYEFTGAPVHSVLLMRTRQEALSYPRGEIRLGLCEGCGLISNTAYDPALQDYSPRCEETQGYSETFNAFARRLASELVERHSLRGRRIIEIGCGKGEFLSTICEMGSNTGVGFDPAFVRGRLAPPPGVSFITDFYSEKYSHMRGDFIICKMTLEHIGQTGSFLSAVRRGLEGSPGAVLFIQVPDATRVLGEAAFWDIYYEHCSYFSVGSLGRLLGAHGFEVTSARTDYCGQYLMLEARPSPAPVSVIDAGGGDIERLRGMVGRFASSVRPSIARWKQRLGDCGKNGLKTVIWGSGSKGVAFLTTLDVSSEVECAVDINPHRHGTFMAGTGHEIVSPGALLDMRPDLVIVMNPAYRQEVEAELARLGVEARVCTV